MAVDVESAGNSILEPKREYLPIISAIVGLAFSLAGLALQIKLAFDVQKMRASPTTELVSQTTELVSQTLLLQTVLLACLVAAVGYLCVIYTNKNHANKKQAITIAHLQERSDMWRTSSKRICEHFLMIVREHHEYCTTLSRRDIVHSEASIQAALVQYLDFVLANTSSLLAEYMGRGYRIACCIKLFTEDKDGLGLPNSSSLTGPPHPWVFTLRRDVGSKGRRVVDETPEGRSYRYQRNTAFHRIVDDTDSPDYFFCNDLASLANYESGNKNWPAHYNATMVVPIKQPHIPAHSQCAAMLCADGMKARFDDGECLYMMEEVATLIYHGLQVAILLLDDLRAGDVNGQATATH